MKNHVELPSLIEQLIFTGGITTTPQKVDFVREKLGSIPFEVEVSGLKITQSIHAYGSVHFVESLEFFSLPQQYFELGLFLLAATIASDGKDRLIHLTNRNSKIRTIRIIGSSYWPLEGKFEQSAFALEINPKDLKKHPWLDKDIDVYSLPILNRGNESDYCYSKKDWEDRDWLVLSGGPLANIRLAELLLKLGHPENDCLEVELEVEGGFRGVGPLSAEARFWLPGSFGWTSD
ncbi:hypothetical protein ACO0LM_20135 [Undibacterium sp. Di26W]|uniref:hypothetical protein n=1 Tax=Undibacterium sp. Di26W TaxID=3413035 RepID=UPI003BF24E90